jgi:hypothetical protein
VLHVLSAIATGSRIVITEIPSSCRPPRSRWAARVSRSSRLTSGASASGPASRSSPGHGPSWSAAHPGRLHCTTRSSGNSAAWASSRVTGSPNAPT